MSRRADVPTVAIGAAHTVKAAGCMKPYLFIAPFLPRLQERITSHRVRPQPPTANAAEWKTSTSELQKVIAGLHVSAPPHSRSHFVRRPRKGTIPFFEGWYLRAVLPETDESFAFMFSVETNTSGGLGTIQVAGPDDVVHFHELDGALAGFRASPRDFKLLHWGVTVQSAGHPRQLDQFQFAKHVRTGYQLEGRRAAGRIPSNSSTRRWCDAIEWDFTYEPLLAWGDRAGKGSCTATRLSHLPIFEPGYQVLMAHGVASGGYIRYGDTSFSLAGARVYAEKNWGASFPSRWWWVQSNAFLEHPDLTVTALGATRLVLGRSETLGMIAVHYNGTLYEFANWNSTMSWNVEWGRWEARCTSTNGTSATIFAETSEVGIMVRGPTADGMQPNIRDAMRGMLQLNLYDENGRALLKNVSCSTAQVEVGGVPWPEPKIWSADVPLLKQPMRGAVNFLGA